MKQLLYILLIFLSLSSSAQYRTIDWKTDIDSVVAVSTDTFWVKVSPTDFNDPGAIDGYYGNYLIDFVGSRYSIVDSTSTAIKVVNEEAGLGVGPQSGQIGRVYRSVGDGAAPFIGGVDMTPLDESARWKKIAADNELFWRNMLTIPVDSLPFSTSYSDLPHRTGMMYFDVVRDNWIFFNSNDEISLDVGEELWTTVYNNTGVTITNGSVCVVTGNGGVVASVVLAKADYPNTINNKIGIATHDIEHGTYGKITIQGNVRDVNTSSYVLSEKLYISEITAGLFTNTKPAFPNYRIFIGYVNQVGVSDGIINIGVTGTPADIIGNLANGSFNESFTFTVASNGTVITGSLVNKAGNDFLTQRWSDGVSLLDVSTPLTVTLTAGSDINPQKQYVYILKSSGNITVSTSYWDATEHIPIAVLYLQSAATTQTYDALRNQNVNNHLADDVGMGGLDHMRKRIRTMPSLWESGVSPSITGSGTATIYPTTGSGKIWQMHLQDMGALDMSTDFGMVTNDFTTANRWISNLATITTDASGGTLNNNSYSVVLWAIQNSAGEPNHLVLNFPTGTYNTAGDAIADLDSKSVYSISSPYRGVGFLIARFTFTNAGGLWTLEDTEDLREAVVGGGGGGGGAGGVDDWFALINTPSTGVGIENELTKVSSTGAAIEATGVTVDASRNLTANTLISDVAIGTSPLTVTSTTLVSNLNTDLLDGQHGSYYLDYTNFTNTPTIEIFEKELTNGENNIDVGFSLASTTLVFFNGYMIPNNRWSGEGTQILNLSLDTKIYDTITIKN